MLVQVDGLQSADQLLLRLRDLKENVQVHHQDCQVVL
jgi:hypothetical protein